MSEGRGGISGRFRDFLSMTRMPFAFIQTIFIILGFLQAGGSDFLRLFLGVVALGPSLIYGGVYILNDIADIDSDRKNPKKEKRAITSSRIGTKNAFFTALSLIAVGFAMALYISRGFALICLIVLLNNLAYSFGPRFKDRLHLGLLSCSLNYPLRFLAGISIANTGKFDILPPLLFFLIALNGFSAYRIYDSRN
ncbi:MAG: UbiA family prenyltransferase, partial [Candidatus Altiarchaeota archaeon]